MKSNRAKRQYITETKLLHEAVEKTCLAMKNKTAVITQNRRLSYAEISDYSNQIASYLRKRGVKPNELVGIFMEKGWEQVIAVLGIMKAGAAYLPLSASEPQNRLQGILKDADVNIVLTQHKHLDKTKTLDDIHSLAISDLPWDTKVNTPNNPVQKPSDLAYVIFTSGSTGKPKGVMLTHENVINTIRDINSRYRVNKDDGIFSVSALNFDLSVYDIFGALIAGARLIIPPEQDTKNPLMWQSWIENEKISIWNSVPAYMQMLVDSKPQQLTSLRLVLLSGDWIPLELPSKIKALNANTVEVISLGGATEAAIWSILYPIDEVNCDWSSIPYGKAMKNQQVIVLDDNLEPLTKNKIGQIYISGIGVAKGYWKDETRTNASFKHAKDNTVYYATGDLGRLMDDGNIEFLGRIDHQVKINGFRVELGEIENVMQKHEAIERAVVLAAHNRIAVYYSCNNTIDKTAIKQYLTKNLPGYMLPKYYIAMPALPLSNNGKVDRKILPEPTANDLVRDNIFEAPQNQQEKLIATIWKENLKIDAVGRHDNFFELGGDSLTAMKVLMAINSTLNTNISMKVLFNNPQLASLAEQVNKQKGATDTIISPNKAHKDIPLTLEQKTMWLHEKSMNDPLIYNESILINLHKKVNVVLLEEALSILTDRHAELKSRVYMKDDNPVQSISKNSRVNFSAIDLTNNTTPTEEMAKITNEIAQTPFDLENENPIRFVYFALQNEDDKLFICAHHLYIDGVAIYHTFLKELSTIYQHLIENTKAELPTLLYSFMDYALHQSQAANTAIAKDDLHFWQENLSTIPAMQMPTKQAKCNNMNCHGKHLPFSFSEKLLSKVKRFCKQHDVTLFDFMLSAFNVMLHHYTHQEELMIYTVTSGRNIPGTDKLMGLFINNLLLKLKNSSNEKFLSVLHNNQFSLRKAMSHEVPFQSLIDELNISSELNKGIKIAFVAEPEAAKTLHGWEPSQLLAHSGRSKFDLLMEIDIKEKAILGRIEFNLNLFEDAFIEDLIQNYAYLLTEIINNTDTPISKLNHMSDARKQEITTQWNQTACDFNITKTLPELFEDRAMAQPNATAITFNNQKISYSDLNNKANNLAQHLIDYGVKPGELVTVVLEKGIEQIISVLAILKIGAAYLPISTTEPSSRLAEITNKAQSQFIITQTRIQPKFDWPKATRVISIDTLELYHKRANITDRYPALDDLAYVIFTSGSTGKPKGVMIEHRAVINTLLAINKQFDIDENASIFSLSKLNFDLSVYDIFGALIAGANIVMPNEEDTRSLVKFTLTA